MPHFFAFIKSGGDPLVNLGGAYFPAWVVCMGVALLATVVVHSVATRIRLAWLVRPAAVMVPAIFVSVACVVWLLIFSR